MINHTPTIQRSLGSIRRIRSRCRTNAARLEKRNETVRTAGGETDDGQGVRAHGGQAGLGPPHVLALVRQTALHLPRGRADRHRRVGRHRVLRHQQGNRLVRQR